MNTQIIELSKLHPFQGQPYKVLDDAEMEALTESVKLCGVMTPLTARPLEGRNQEYEIVSGHRRMRAAEKAGLKTVPAFVVPLDRTAAAIVLVDSNLHREHLLPSEKAFAYKLKLDALKQQGKRNDLTSRQDVEKLGSAEHVSETESGRQVQRYIRLTYLIPNMLNMVDEGRIALTPAVYLSYLSEPEQVWVLEEMQRNDCTPSLGQAQRLKEHGTKGLLTRDFVTGLMAQEKANQLERLKIPVERIRKFFPASYTAAQMEAEIVKMCEARYRKRASMER